MRGYPRSALAGRGYPLRWKPNENDYTRCIFAGHGIPRTRGGVPVALGQLGDERVSSPHALMWHAPMAVIATGEQVRAARQVQEATK